MDRSTFLTPQIDEFLDTIGSGYMGSSAYDTAWLAQLGELSPRRSVQALDWLRAHQHDDGSWGTPDFEYAHDRLICTLSGMLALTRHGYNGDHKRVTRAGETLGK